MENRYEIIIFWSNEDRAFLADVPELPGCMAHGSSHEEALRNAQEAIQLWIETAEEDGRIDDQRLGPVVGSQLKCELIACHEGIKRRIA